MRKPKIQFPDYEDYFRSPSLSDKEVCGLVSNVWPEDPFMEVTYFGGNNEVAIDEFANGKAVCERFGRVCDYFLRLAKADAKLRTEVKNEGILTIAILDRMAQCPDAAPEFIKAYSNYRKKSFGAHVGWDGFDPDDKCYSLELDIAFNVWRSISKNRNNKDSVKRQIEQWLKDHYPNLLAAQIARISTIVNWEKSGGRPSNE